MRDGRQGEHGADDEPVEVDEERSHDARDGDPPAEPEQGARVAAVEARRPLQDGDDGGAQVVEDGHGDAARGYERGDDSRERPTRQHADDGDEERRRAERRLHEVHEVEPLGRFEHGA